MTMVGPKTKRLVIQERVITPDDRGDPVTSWNTIGTRWGSVQGIRGAEKFTAAHVVADVSHRVRMNYDPLLLTITPSHHLLLSRQDSPETFRTFDIFSIVNIDEANVEFEILVTETYE